MELKYTMYLENDDKVNKCTEHLVYCTFQYSCFYVSCININENFSFHCIIMSIANEFFK